MPVRGDPQARNVLRGQNIGGALEGLDKGGGDEVIERSTLLARALATLAPVVSAVTTALSPLTAVTSAVGSTLSTLAGAATTAGVAFAGFSVLASGVNSLLSALNPGLTQALGYSLRELQATFGLLVEPIARELVPLFREVAATLQPAFRALAPTVSALAQAFGKIVNALAGAFVTVIEAFAPILADAAELFSQVVTALSPLIKVVATLVAALAPLLGALLSGLMPVIQWLTKALVILVGGILQMFGATKQLDEMISALEPQKAKPQSAIQALTNPQYVGFSELGRQLALSAAIATGGTREEKKDTPAWLSEIAGTLKGLRDNTTSLGEIIRKAIVDAMQGAASSANQGIYNNFLEPFLDFGRGQVRRAAAAAQGS